MTLSARTRIAIKWAGTALTAIVFLMWIGSKWAFVSYTSSSGWTYEVTSGGVFVASGPPTGASSWNGKIRTTHLDLWWVFENPGVYWALFVPTWPLVGLSAAATLLAWRLDAVARRRERGERQNPLELSESRVDGERG